MSYADLQSIPEGVTAADEALAALDDAFVTGFGRLSSANLEALAGLQRSFAATPLGAAFAEAIEGIARSEFVDRHFLVLAAARAALHGAAHDALVAQACAALDRPAPEREAIDAGASQDPPPQVAIWLESTRQWLMELALAGFANLEVDILLPFQATLDAISGEPRLARQAALLSGLLGEFLEVFPCRGTPEVPRQRWSDLWTRAMVLSAAPPEAIRSRPVKGELRLLGADVREHDNFATLVAYGALYEAGHEDTPRLVRTSASAFKVDVIQGAELGPLLADVASTLLAALAATKKIAIDGMSLSDGGDLLWDDTRAKLGGAADPLAEAAALLDGGKTPAARPTLAPADRHPALIEEPIYLASFGRNDKPELEIDGATIPLAVDRWPTSDDLGVDSLDGTKGLFGLLRFDAGQWSIQPLTAVKGRGKGKLHMLGQAIAGGKAGRTSSLAILKERASKLLRAK
jgi:hypothetical protein